VIPAKNEARNLRFVLPHLTGAVHEIILVDGHSIDDTVAVAQGMDPSVRVVAQVGHGKGDALRRGFEAATGDIIVTLDADGSTDPREIPRFVAALVDGADVAKGSRFLAPEHMMKAGSSDITLLRRLGNRALNGVVNMLFGTRFTDLCYGYNAFWCDCLELFEVDAAGFEVETLVSLRARKANLKIVEVPSYELSRVHGKSNLHAFSDGWRVLKTILREYRNGQEVIITRKLPISPRPTKAPQ
jgi:glycosyltransferase involved in cell wall biosynthesis